MDRVIPVVTTTDSAYVLNCYVTIFSIINASDKKNAYYIYIMTTNLGMEDITFLESLSQEKITVKCVDISDIVKNVNLQQTMHFPIQTYYRVFIPLAFPNYEKILYLDSDLCVLHDISELYDIDLEGHAVGVVRDVPCIHLAQHEKEIGNLDCKRTFNSGVMLMDIKAFERECVRERCLALLSEDYEREKRKLIYADNDALNIVLYDEWKCLDDAWNFQWQYQWQMDVVYGEYQGSYRNTAQNPYIIHFAGKVKPWTHPEYPMAEVFWDLAEKAEIARKIAFKYIVDIRKNKEIFDCFEVFRFPYSRIPSNSKIAIYAAGKVGKAFFEQMQIIHYAEVIVWVDKNYGYFQCNKFVDSPKELLERKAEYQYVIVAIEDKQIADDAVFELMKMGIAEDKLVWEQYKIKKE